jgi:Tol biopolymer transport system component
VLFVGRERDGSGPWLWELDVETRELNHAAPAVHIYKSLSASRDRTRLVATVANPKAGLWTVPILPEGVAKEEDVRAHPLQAVRALAPRIHGDRLYYLSSVGGRDGLWRVRDGKSELIWKASGKAWLHQAAAIAPDGTRVAIVVREDVRGRLYVINADGTEPRPLAEELDVVGAACWSPDGEWIAAGGLRNGETGLYRIRVRDGQTDRIQPMEAMNPVWSPDGRMIVYAGAQVGPGQRLHAAAPDGTAMELPRIEVAVHGERVRFRPDGSGLVVLTGFDPYHEFHLIDLESGSSRMLAKFSSSASMRAFDITPDGETIVFDRQRDNCDIVLIKRDVAK